MGIWVRGPGRGIEKGGKPNPSVEKRGRAEKQSQAGSGGVLVPEQFTKYIVGTKREGGLRIMGGDEKKKKDNRPEPCLAARHPNFPREKSQKKKNEGKEERNKKMCSRNMGRTAQGGDQTGGRKIDAP